MTAFSMRTASIYLLAALFVGAGLAHFGAPSLFVEIVPPYIPHPRLVVYVSGAAEIAGGIGLLVPGWRRRAGWGLLLLLIAVLPVHVYMARAPEAFPSLPHWALYGRLLLQFGLMGWVYGTACRPRA
jgi:uncharacterized membrane protein